MKGTSATLIILVFWFSAMNCQNDSQLVNTARGNTLKKLGRNALLQNDPNSAVTLLDAYCFQRKNDAEGWRLLGTAYMRTRDYDRASHAFLKSHQLAGSNKSDALYYHAQMQKSRNRYDSAKTAFQEFRKKYRGPNRAIKRQAAREIVYCDSIGKILAIRNEVRVNRLDNSINKVNTESAPLLLDENTMVYASLRTDSKAYSSPDDESTMVRKLYIARRVKGAWQFGGEFEELNDAHANTGNPTLSADKKRLYFTRCKPNMFGEMVCRIFMSEKKANGSWSEPIDLPEPVNSRRYTATMPAVGVDPAKGHDILYFVSNRKKGKGGLDIWYTVYNKRTKKFSNPRNAGPKINTSGDEITPFVENESRTLYFSSDARGGLGGFDIYKATGDGRKWLLTENLGKPYNSGADDLYYTAEPEREEGFFVSNRKGGNALKNVTCCDDIYAFKNIQSVRMRLKGTVCEVPDGTQPVAQATVEIYVKSKDTDEKVLVSTTVTDKTGNFKVPLELDKEYVVVAKKPDYLGTIVPVNTFTVRPASEATVMLTMMKRPRDPITIPHVNYDFDKADLNKRAVAAIDSMLLPILEANPEIIIEIQSHTDSKGTESYNRKLSQRRANEIVRFLNSRGIPPRRLRARGYGEDVPVAPNENADGTDNPEGRAQNRRTQFRIIGDLAPSSD